MPGRYGDLGKSASGTGCPLETPIASTPVQIFMNQILKKKAKAPRSRRQNKTAIKPVTTTATVDDASASEKPAVNNNQIEVAVPVTSPETQATQPAGQTDAQASATEQGTTPAPAGEQGREIKVADMFYHTKQHKFWYEDDHGKWISVDAGTAKKLLALQGVRIKCNEGEELSPADIMLLDIRASKNVEFAGPLAGHKAGHRIVNRSSILVTESPNLLVPAKGEWKLLGQFLCGMFNNPPEDQLPYLFALLQRGLRSFYSNTWSQSQAVALIGPAGAGKSLFQSLVTVMFGGRSAKPHLFMSGRTNFNGDLARAEHLMMEDDRESCGDSQRRALGNHIKQIAVNHFQHCHAKFAQGVSLDPIWRLTLSLNDNPERLRILPEMDSGTADKFMLFKVAVKKLPEVPAGTENLFEALAAELPAFVFHLMNEWVMPEEIGDARYGVKHYHHPDILAQMEQFNPEADMVRLIDQALFSESSKVVKLKAVDIYKRLTEKGFHAAYQATKVMQDAVKCGRLMASLCKRQPNRFTSRKLRGDTQYIIQPPVAPVVVMVESNCTMPQRTPADMGIGGPNCGRSDSCPTSPPLLAEPAQIAMSE